MDAFPSLIQIMISYYQWKAKINQLHQEYHRRVWIKEEIIVGPLFEKEKLYWKAQTINYEITVIKDNFLHLPKSGVSSFLPKIAKETEITNQDFYSLYPSQRFRRFRRHKKIADLPKNYYYSDGSAHLNQNIFDLFR